MSLGLLTVVFVLCNYADLLGKRFEYGGVGLESFDCYGLVQELYKRRGVELPSFKSISDPELIHNSMSEGKELFQKIESPEAWCVVMFCVRPPYVSHVGVVLPNLYQFIHTMHKVNVCVERLDSNEWHHRIRGYYKWHRKP